jgi:hypothetical protein
VSGYQGFSRYHSTALLLRLVHVIPKPLMAQLKKGGEAGNSVSEDANYDLVIQK